MNWWSRYSATGINGKPTLANAAAGKVLVEAAIDKLTRIAAEFRDAPELERRDLRAKPDLEIRPTS
jgi:hypothetical protein